MGHSKRTKVVVGVVGGIVIAACVVAIVFLLKSQERTDHGSRIVVFNNAKAPIAVTMAGEHRTLAPRQTWRSDPLDSGTVHVQVASDAFDIDVRPDSCFLVPATQTSLLVANPSGAYAVLMKGRMAGASSAIATFAPSRFVRVENHRWVLSPYEALPAETGGAIPYKAILISEDTRSDPDKVNRWLAEMDRVQWSTVD